MARTPACIAIAAALLTSPATRRAESAETPLRVVVVAPSGDPFGADVVAGVGLAVAQANDAKAAGAKRPAVESTVVDAGDSSITALALEKAAKEKAVGVVALATEKVAEVLEANARRLKVPLVLVG